MIYDNVQAKLTSVTWHPTQRSVPRGAEGRLLCFLCSERTKQMTSFNSSAAGPVVQVTEGQT